MNVEHYAQIHESGRFQEYDYGPQGNLNRYNSQTPPEFDLAQITNIPIAVFVQAHDNEGNERDNQWLIQQIEDILIFNRTIENFAHYDLYVAEDTRIYLDDVINLLQQYNHG